MKAYLLLFLLFFSFGAFAQTSEVAVGDTAATSRTNRMATKYDASGIPYAVRKGRLPQRIAYYNDMTTFGNGLYVSLTGSYNNPGWLTGIPYSKVTGSPTTLSGYGITDADPYLTAATYSAMNALVFSANTAKRVLVVADEMYSKSNQWYMLWADSGGSMHADKIVTISEK